MNLFVPHIHVALHCLEKETKVISWGRDTGQDESSPKSPHIPHKIASPFQLRPLAATITQFEQYSKSKDLSQQSKTNQNKTPTGHSPSSGYIQHDRNTCKPLNVKAGLSTCLVWMLIRQYSEMRSFFSYLRLSVNFFWRRWQPHYPHA